MRSTCASPNSVLFRRSPHAGRIERSAQSSTSLGIHINRVAGKVHILCFKLHLMRFKRCLIHNKVHVCKLYLLPQAYSKKNSSKFNRVELRRRTQSNRAVVRNIHKRRHNLAEGNDQMEHFLRSKTSAQSSTYPGIHIQKKNSSKFNLYIFDEEYHQIEHLLGMFTNSTHNPQVVQHPDSTKNTSKTTRRFVRKRQT